MKLSIIIPVYNVEQYINKCLTSCLEQDIPLTEYEIIVVNDGSHDNSMAIVEQIATTATNIKIISQKNCGLSVARNTGLGVAKGEYIWFIDSDDWIEKNCLGKLTTLCNGVDFIAISFNKIWNDKQECHYTKDADNGKLLLKNGAQEGAQFYIMRREFLEANNLTFMQGVFHEDAEFIPRMAYMANGINTIRDCVYNYRQRDNSIMSTLNPQRCYDLITVANSLYTFSNKYVEKEYIISFNNIISSCINESLRLIIQTSSQEKEIWTENIKKQRHLFKAMFGSNRRENKVKSIIFLATPAQFILGIYRLMTFTTSLISIKKRK